MQKKIWNTPGKTAFVIVLLAVLVAAVIFAFARGSDHDDPMQSLPPGTRPIQTTPPGPTEAIPTTVPMTTEPTEATDPEQTIERTEPTEPDEELFVPDVTEAPQYSGLLELPCLTADGMLSVDSVFQFSGMNPDDDMEEGEDLAAIMLTNVSDSHLTRAELTVTMADGTEACFLVEDLPAGKTVLVCDRMSTVLEDPDICTDIACEAEFADEDVLQRDKLFYALDGMEITLTNLTGEPLSGIEVYCHTILNESYLGGCVYRYSVDVLSAGQSTTILAPDCFLGAEVVRITAGG